MIEEGLTIMAEAHAKVSLTRRIVLILKHLIDAFCMFSNSTPKTNYAKLVLLKRFIHRSQFNLVKYHCSDYIEYVRDNSGELLHIKQQLINFIPITKRFCVLQNKVHHLEAYMKHHPNI